VDNKEYLEAAKYWKEKFNGQDFDTRHLNVASSLSTQITELELEKSRTKRAYDSHLKEVNDKIKYIKGELIMFRRES